MTKSDASSGSGRDPVEQLLESFIGRLRRGERPSLEEYVARCPERAAEIRELFPAMVEMEQLKPAVESATGPREQSAHQPESGARPAAPHPERLGDYRILRVIGEGGMGVVYEAEHESLSNRVALKVMHTRFRADSSYLRRFRQEARSAARLHHTNIVPVFDFGEQDGICYYAMQYICGVGLNDVFEDVRRLRDGSGGAERTGTDDHKGDRHTEPIGRTVSPVSCIANALLSGRFESASAAPTGSDGRTLQLEPNQSDETAALGEPSPPLPAPKGTAPTGDSSSSFAGQPESIYFREIARLGTQVADALDHAHRQGVVHRDIKPSNLLLDAHGNIWLTDFGLAKLLEGGELSQSRDTVGTLRFMAPERFRGVTDPRGDIYGVGATLYEMLALRPAFDQRDQIQLIDRITHEAPAPLRQLDRRIPRDLETIVLKALSKDPKDRFATAGELRDELRRFLEGRPLRSRPVGPAEQFWRWCKRNPGLAAANITAALLTAILAIGATIAAWTYRDQLHRLDIEQGNTQANLNWAIKAERQGRLELGKSLQAEGAALLRSGLVGQRFDSLERLGKAAGLLREQPEGRTRLPDLRDLAITAMGLSDLRRIQRREIGPIMGLACDATLERYAITELLAKERVGGQAVVRSMADDRELLRVPRPGQSFWWGWPDFSPDGQYVAVVYQLSGGGFIIDVWQLDRKELVFRQRSPGDAPIFHPDGRRLIFRPTEKKLAVWDLREGRETKRMPLEFAPRDVCLDPDGRRVAVNAAGASRKVEIIELEPGRLLAMWVENVGNGVLSWSRDGRLLAMGNDDSRVLVWDVERGCLASVLHEHMRELNHCRFSPTGHMFVTSSGGSTRLWNASSGELLVTASVGTHNKFSTDGRRLAVYEGSHLDIWELAQDQERLTLNPGLIGNATKLTTRGWIHAARFSPDGRLIAIGTEEAAYLHDGQCGRELAQLKTGAPCNAVLFDRDGRNLVTYSGRGMFRWPIRDDPAGGADALRIGPPVLLRETTSDSWFRASWLPDGRTLAMLEKTSSRVLLVDTDDPHPARKRARALLTPSRSRMISIAVSPDGRWAAAGGWNDLGVYVWDLPRRRFERILPRGDSPADGHTLPAFSPDGRWLVCASTITGASGYYFWEVGTWKRGSFIPIPVASGWGEPVFSPDGAVIALCHAPNQVRLAETATGRTIAHLTTLQSLAPVPLAFSVDGSRLVAATNRHTALIWDLRRIRARLKTMGLDWDGPPLPPEEASPAAGVVAVRSVRVIGAALEPTARRAGELVACEARLREHRDDVEALLDRGWLKLQMAKAAEAIPDLERSLLLRPDDADAQYLLASAQIETNDRAAASATLEKYLAHAGDDTDARALKARLALQLGKLQEAAADSGKVLDLDPSRDGVRFSRAQIWLRLGKLEDALADLDSLVPKYPQDGSLLGLRGQVHDRLGHKEQALADLKQAGELRGADADSYNERAWNLATGPAALRDPQQAVALAQKAVAASPDTAIYLNTLGVAQYRAGQFAEAIATLEESLAAAKGESDAFDLFFLAMAQYRLGRVAQARADFARAVRWRREHPNLRDASWSRQLDDFQAEAQALLNGPAELPADAFAPGPGVPKGLPPREGAPASAVEKLLVH